MSSLFPNAHLNLGFLDLDAPRLFAVMAALAVLPTVWLRDMSVLSYISGDFILTIGFYFFFVLVFHYISSSDHLFFFVCSTLSAGGVVASILVVACLFWAGLIDDVGFQPKGTILNLSSLPVAIGLYGYCYSGHAVFPNIYTSMDKPSQYPAVLLTRYDKFQIFR